MRALIRAGFLPRIGTSRAAVPVTCGAAMLVPCAPTIKVGNGAQLISKLVWLHAAHTKTSRLAGGASGGAERAVPAGRGDIDGGSEVGVVGEGIGGREGTIGRGGAL